MARKKKTYEVMFERTIYSSVRVRAWNLDDAIEKAELDLEDAHYERETDDEVSDAYEVTEQ
jgi:hypothetical protein